MSELGIATEASDKILLAVNSHLNEGNIEEAVARFFLVDLPTLTYPFG